MIFAKEQRITVLRAISGNPRLDASVALVLLEKAVSRRDEEMLASLAKKLPVLTVATALAQDGALGVFPTRSALEMLTPDHSRSDLLDTLSLKERHLTEFFGHVLAKASAGFFENFSLQDAVSVINRDLISDVLVRALVRAEVISSELAEISVASSNVAAAFSEKTRIGSSTLESGALAVFLSDPNLDQYRRRLVIQRVPAEDLLSLFDATVALLQVQPSRTYGPDSPVWSYVKTHHEVLTPKEAQAVARFLLDREVKNTSILDACFRNIRNLLESSLRTELLTKCSPHLIAEWMTDLEKGTPLEGEATTVLSGLSSEDLHSVASSVASCGRDTLLHPLWGEYRTALGPGLLAVASSNRWDNWLMDDIVGFLAFHLGDSPASWSLVVSLWPSFQGSLVELLDLATSLS
jgi:hypothetical protein